MLDNCLYLGSNFLAKSMVSQMRAKPVDLPPPNWVLNPNVKQRSAVQEYIFASFSLTWEWKSLSNPEKREYQLSHAMDESKGKLKECPSQQDAATFFLSMHLHLPWTLQPCLGVGHQPPFDAWKIETYEEVASGVLVHFSHESDEGSVARAFRLFICTCKAVGWSCTSSCGWSLSRQPWCQQLLCKIHQFRMVPGVYTQIKAHS